MNKEGYTTAWKVSHHIPCFHFPINSCCSYAESTNLLVPSGLGLGLFVSQLSSSLLDIPTIHLPLRPQDFEAATNDDYAVVHRATSALSTSTPLTRSMTPTPLDDTYPCTSTQVDPIVTRMDSSTDGLTM